MGRHSKNYKIGMGIVFLIILYFIGKVFSAIGDMFKATGYTIPIIIVVCGVSYFIYKFVQKKNYEKRIHAKYIDNDIATKVISNQIWQGQTEEQLKDSLGYPVDIDRTVLKTKTKEVWKYHKKSAKRYGLKVMLDNGIVTGWENKN